MSNSSLGFLIFFFSLSCSFSPGDQTFYVFHFLSLIHSFIHNLFSVFLPSFRFIIHSFVPLFFFLSLPPFSSRSLTLIPYLYSPLSYLSILPFHTLSLHHLLLSPLSYFIIDSSHFCFATSFFSITQLNIFSLFSFILCQALILPNFSFLPLSLHYLFLSSLPYFITHSSNFCLAASFFSITQLSIVSILYISSVSYLFLLLFPFSSSLYNLFLFSILDFIIHVSHFCLCTPFFSVTQLSIVSLFSFIFSQSLIFPYFPFLPHFPNTTSSFPFPFLHNSP